jgi:hypothetical protein
MGAPSDKGKSFTPRGIAILTLSAAAIGGLILFGFVLPAEYGRDPTGLGKLTGSAKLFAPQEIKIAPVVGRAPAQRSEKNLSYHQHMVRIPLAAAGDPKGGDKVEYKVRQPVGATFVYDWSVSGLPEDMRSNFYSQLHGHTLESREAMTVVEYRTQLMDRDAGTVTSTVDGINGWYFENRAKTPVTVEVKIAGFYTLVAPGEDGNEAAILPLENSQPAEAK